MLSKVLVALHKDRLQAWFLAADRCRHQAQKHSDVLGLAAQRCEIAGDEGQHVLASVALVGIGIKARLDGLGHHRQQGLACPELVVDDSSRVSRRFADGRRRDRVYAVLGDDRHRRFQESALCLCPALGLGSACAASWSHSVPFIRVWSRGERRPEVVERVSAWRGVLHQPPVPDTVENLNLRSGSLGGTASHRIRADGVVVDDQETQSGTLRGAGEVAADLGHHGLRG
jgi:hypothetical protein